MTQRPDAHRQSGPSIEQVSSRVVYSNPWMTLREDVIRRPDGSEGVYSYVEEPDFALIIPIDREGFHLVEQYRYPGRTSVMGVSAGDLAQPGEKATY